MRNMKKGFALALCAVSLGLASHARAATYLTNADKAYLRSLGQDPNAEWIVSLNPVQQRALHNVINKNTDPNMKKNTVNKFLDDAVGEYLANLAARANQHR